MNKLAYVFAILLTCTPLHAHEGLHEQIAALTRRIAAEPKNAALYLQRGELHRLHEEWKLAAADYDRAEKLDPSLDLVALARGRMFVASGAPRLALPHLDRFLAAHPEHSVAHLTRARALAALERGADAVAAYDAAIAHASPVSPDLYYERAKLLEKLGRIDDALRGLDEGLERLGVIASLQEQAIALELRAGRFEAAQARRATLPARARRPPATRP